MNKEEIRIEEESFHDRHDSLIKFLVDNIVDLKLEYEIVLLKPNYKHLIISSVNDNDVSILGKEEFSDSIDNYNTYNLELSYLKIHVHNNFDETFRKIFEQYLEENMLTYDNLIHVCIMVKDAGEGFEQILEKNLPFVDKWTVLDTGSTDQTILTIKKVFKNKRGKLYEESFINFRDSRNRCLDLADQFDANDFGNPCVFNIMLDDTYYLEGNIRQYLSSKRCVKDIDSFHIYIRCDEGEYASNRICRSSSKLRYIFTIHEVIQNYDNNLENISSDIAFIRDEVNEYMKNRTKERKIGDVILLENEISEDPEQPRNYFYLAQTYISLENYEKAVEFYLKRIKFLDTGNREEVTECYYNCGLLGDQHLNWPWNKCEYYLNKCHIHEPRKPDALYYIGYHYVFYGEEEKGYKYFKKAFELGNPNIFNLFIRDKEIYNNKLPLYMLPLCHKYSDYKIGFQAAERYLLNNPLNDVVISWLNIYRLLSHNETYTKMYKKDTGENYKPVICFVADGNFREWNGNSIYEEGVGGSETYIIEMARNLAKIGKYEVHVYCKCGDKKGKFDDVYYEDVGYYVKFLREKVIHTVIISRYSQYIPVTYKNGVDNVILVCHDLIQAGQIFLNIDNLKILCMSDWHKEYYLDVNKHPIFKNITEVFPNGINISDFPINKIRKRRYSFIYSSFPNRGLLNLLKMFPFIKRIYPEAILNVFCDLENEYVLSVSKDEIEEIKKLLKSQKDYIFNHGWVSKSVLNSYWMKSEIWIYPCKFQETFCITALEAAASKTLAITNNLGALQNTVGNRGVIIPGDPSNNEWFKSLINVLQQYYDNSEPFKKLIEENRRWAEEHDWEKLSKIFESKFIKRMNYAGMLNWTVDVPKGSQKPFMEVLSTLMGKSANILEIGTYVGTSAINIIKLLPDCQMTVIDKWKNYEENKSITNKLEESDIEDKFYVNLNIAEIEPERINVIKRDSKSVLLDMYKKEEKYDFIYIDGDHRCFECYTDIILSWELLKKGGIIAMDDYLWQPEQNNTFVNKPHEAINHFIEENEKNLRLLHKGYRVFIQKI